MQGRAAVRSIRARKRRDMRKKEWDGMVCLPELFEAGITRSLRSQMADEFRFGQGGGPVQRRAGENDPDKASYSSTSGRIVALLAGDCGVRLVHSDLPLEAIDGGLDPIAVVSF